MAKERHPEQHAGLEVPFADFLRRVATSRLHAMTAFEEGTRAGDPEAIHDLRVAIRRLRSAMRLARGLFPDRVRSRRMESVLRELARALGRVRDLDVLLLDLEGYRAEARPQDEPHLDRLAAVLGGRRAACREGLDARLKGFARPRRLARIEALIGTLRARANRSHLGAHAARRLRTPAGVVPEMSTLDAARLILPRLLADMWRLEEAVSDPSRESDHHRLRISSKRLRYAMETLTTLFPPEFAELIQPLRQVQDLLGRVHDDDAFVPVFQQYLAERRGEAGQQMSKIIFARPMAHLSLDNVRGAVVAGDFTSEREAILRLIGRTRTRRKTGFAEFQVQWRNLERQGFRRKFMATIDPTADSEPSSSARAVG